MPELPEVEVAARNLSRWALGRRVREVQCFDARSIEGARPSSLRKLIGSRLSAVERTGKNLLPRSRAARVRPWASGRIWE